MQMTKKSIIGAAQKLVENMKVSLVVILMNNSRLFQQIIQNVTAIWDTLPIEIYIHVFSKSRGIVIPVGFCISKGFEDWISLEQFVLHWLNIVNVTWSGSNEL